MERSVQNLSSEKFLIFLKLFKKLNIDPNRKIFLYIIVNLVDKCKLSSFITKAANIFYR